MDTELNTKYCKKGFNHHGTCAKSTVSMTKVTAYAINGTVNSAKKAACRFAVFATLGTEAQIEIDTDVVWVANIQYVKTAKNGQERRPRHSSSWTRRKKLAPRRAKSRVRATNGQRQSVWMRGIWTIQVRLEVFIHLRII